MTNYYKPDEIQSKGGNLIALVELDTDFAIPTVLTAGTNCINLGHIQESTDGVTSKKTDKMNERGQIVSTEFDYTGSTTGTLMQRSATIRNFLANKVRDKIYLEIKNLGIVGKNTHERFSIVKVSANDSVKTPDGTIKYESSYIVPQSDTTFDTEDFTAIETALGITIAATSATIKANEESSGVVATAIS